jgi:hypothetical protein
MPLSSFAEIALISSGMWIGDVSGSETDGGVFIPTPKPCILRGAGAYPPSVMSLTTTTSESQKAPEITILNRVFSIPLVQSSLEKVNSTLSTNPHTLSPFSTAKGLFEAAYKLSEPLQCSIAPIIAHVDSYANKAVDMVESRYPYPFTATPEEVYNSIHEIQQQYADYATRTYDEQVRKPAQSVAQGIDKVCLLLSMHAVLGSHDSN